MLCMWFESSYKIIQNLYNAVTAHYAPLYKLKSFEIKMSDWKVKLAFHLPAWTMNIQNTLDYTVLAEIHGDNMSLMTPVG